MKSYWRGVRDGLPFVLVACPFALLFGVVAAEAGLSLAATMGFSFLVIAGAAQFAAVQLMSEGAVLIFFASA
jgi:predicted branched-subunit amino acid permease